MTLEEEGNKMKTLIKNLAFLIGFSFLFSGCYTIVWDPSQEFPQEVSSSEGNEFYGTDYFGGYGGFYETPWWAEVPVYIISPNGPSDKNQTKERKGVRTSDTQNIRNEGGRGNADTRDTGSTNTNTNNTNIINTPPPTRDSGSNTDSGSTYKSGNTNSSSSSNGNRSSSSSDTRNSSGSRNSGSGRK